MTTDVRRRNNVVVGGAAAGRPLVFVHGFGCDQSMWRWTEPALGAGHPTVRLDLVGAGASDLSVYDPGTYDSLDGHADDLVRVCADLDLHDAVVVGHSVGAMIAVLAAPRAAGRIGALVLVAPSPRFLDDPADGYRGGFSSEDLDELLETLAANHLGWSMSMAPVVMGHADRPELAGSLADSFCRTDPEIAQHFARVTFLSDHRRDLARVTLPTLVLQGSHDALAPVAVGEYVHGQIAGSRLVVLPEDGHCPHVSSPDAVVAAVRDFLA